MRCVILQANHGVWKFFGKRHLNFFCLDEDGYIKRGYRIELFQKITNNLCILRECIHSAKIDIRAFIMGQYALLQNGRTEAFKVDWYPFKLGTCCMLHGDFPLYIRQASCTRIIAQVTSMFRSAEMTLLSPFRCHFLYLYHKKFEHFVENNYVISLTLEEGFPNHHSIQSAHFK